MPAVGVGLLAKAFLHPTFRSPDTPLSRASPLPHLISVTSTMGDRHHSHTGCGTIPATFSHTRIDNAHERPPHTQTCAQEA
ncbi:hypothetical protein C5612_04170 [Pseudomonas frederiksbergensis]|uniref:Uncharacterized protein n=1 Tax=Pseudomonas frederiksbergensis TaxID=104087 RepID=A0A2S8HTF1_9PSED|nr:hypothetical protein C5612_04170 [Pseudomonas frederiksbergensis]